MKLSQRLTQIIAEKHLLNHLFYQAWSAGELSQDVLKDYAVQYYKQVSSFPRFISRIHSICPEIQARKVLLENLVDEEIHGTDHPELWMQFAEGLGADRKTVLAEAPIIETQQLVENFFNLASRDWRDGLCALFAYESQVPAVAASKIDGLKKFYGITDARSLEFFVAHLAYDVGHAEQVATLIDHYADPVQAEKSTAQAVDALWGFLDGMCRIAGMDKTSCSYEERVS
jgi:pyrroloquinoline-quinone synthase